MNKTINAETAEIAEDYVFALLCELRVLCVVRWEPHFCNVL